MERIRSTKEFVSTTAKAVALAMSVAVVVTNILGLMDQKSQIILLGIGLFCIAMINLDKE